MDTNQAAPEEWLQALDRSRADLAAGRVVDGAGVRARLRDTIARMEAGSDPDSEPQPEPGGSSVPSLNW